MGLIEAYKRYLLLEHNREFYKYNTFLIRFFKSETDIEEIFGEGFIEWFEQFKKK